MPLPHSPSILVVEDESIVALDLQESLRAMGYDPYAVAASADEAIACVTERCPDLVLMDIRIRGDRDGIETAAMLRERFLVPVLFLTAHADDATVARAKATTPHGYLLKPVRAAELRSAIEVALYRHEVEKRLRERERWFSTTLRSIGDAVITVDLAGKVTFMNQVAERLTGVTLDQALGKPAGDVIRLDHGESGHDTTPLDRALLHRETVELVEAALVGGGTDTRIIADSAAPVIDKGQLLGAVMVFRDVTEQKQLQQRLELADRLASLGTMAAGVAHEVNNPLAVVMGHASHLAEEATDMLRRLDAKTATPEQTRELLAEVLEAQAEVQSAATRIQRIVADLKAFSRPGPEAAGTANIARAIEWARRATVLDVAPRATMEIHQDDIELYASIDELRLGQVMVNLLTNAAHAVPPGNPAGNTITVDVSRREDGYICIAVADSGTGISETVLQRMFEPFFTTKALGVGTGLGLSICHGIVKHAGGDIEVESELGRGSTFRVVLAPANRQRTPLPPGRPELRRGRLLVVDDELPLLRLMKRVLHRHEVECVTNAAEALALLNARQRFDVIICDIMMPGMTGIELYETLLERAPTEAARMIFISGGTVGKTDDFRRAVPNRFVDKPFTADVIEEAVQSVLRRYA